MYSRTSSRRSAAGLVGLDLAQRRHDGGGLGLGHGRPVGLGHLVGRDAGRVDVGGLQDLVAGEEVVDDGREEPEVGVDRRLGHGRQEEAAVRGVGLGALDGDDRLLAAGQQVDRRARRAGHEADRHEEHDQAQADEQGQGDQGGLRMAAHVGEA